jgi:hypothetical protein
VTRHRLSAGFYAPVRVLLRESAKGGAAFEYDRPRSVFEQFNDGNINTVALELDEQLGAVLKKAAGLNTGWRDRGPLRVPTGELYKSSIGYFQIRKPPHISSPTSFSFKVTHYPAVPGSKDAAMSGFPMSYWIAFRSDATNYSEGSRGAISSSEANILCNYLSRRRQRLRTTSVRRRTFMAGQAGCRVIRASGPFGFPLPLVVSALATAAAAAAAASIIAAIRRVASACCGIAKPEANRPSPAISTPSAAAPAATPSGAPPANTAPKANATASPADTAPKANATASPTDTASKAYAAASPAARASRPSHRGGCAFVCYRLRVIFARAVRCGERRCTRANQAKAKSGRCAES